VVLLFFIKNKYSQYSTYLKKQRASRQESAMPVTNRASIFSRRVKGSHQRVKAAQRIRETLQPVWLACQSETRGKIVEQRRKTSRVAGYFFSALLTISSPYQFELSRYFAQMALRPRALTKNNSFSVSGFNIFAAAVPCLNHEFDITVFIYSIR